MNGEFDYLLEPTAVPPVNDPQPSDNDEQLPPSDTPVIDGDDADTDVVGLENLSYGDMYSQLVNDKSPKVTLGDATCATRQSGNQLNIRTSDQKNFRIWLRAQHWFTSEYINRLCRFLDSRAPDESVTLYVGCKLEDRQACIVGAVVSAIVRCQCKIRCVATGYCGVPETMLFAFCKEREIRKYGALSIGGTSITYDLPMYKAFYVTFYEQLIAIGLITKEERDEIWELSKEIIIFPDEYYRKVRN